MDKFFIRTKEDFAKLLAENKVVTINFENQAERLLEEGQLIFTETSDGYMYIKQKKGYGLSKGKSEIYVHEYGGVPQTLRIKDPKKAIEQFTEFFNKNDGEFFYIENLENIK